MSGNSGISFKPIVDKKTNNDVYINLDSILDTRLATLFKLDKKLAIDILTNNEAGEKYFTRHTDRFGNLSPEVFNRFYQKRDNNTILEPIPTMIMPILHSYVGSIIENEAGKIVVIHLNTYPYDLNKKDTDKIVRAIMAIFNNLVDVEIINKPESEITVKFIHENIGLMVMYNGLKWVEFNMSNRNLLSLNLPDVTMLVPKLFNNNIFAKSSIDDVFKDYEKTVQPFIQLLFLSPRVFSVKKNKKE